MILWVSRVTGTFQGQSEADIDVSHKCEVERIVKRLKLNGKICYDFRLCPARSLYSHLVLSKLQ